MSKVEVSRRNQRQFRLISKIYLSYFLVKAVDYMGVIVNDLKRPALEVFMSTNTKVRDRI